MKSKSFDLTRSPADKQKLNKTLDFVGLYKSAADTSKLVEKRKPGDVLNKETLKSKGGSANRERSPNKNRKKSKAEQVDVSQITIDGSTLNASFGGSSPVNSSRVTSTPNASAKVKSIMKNNPAVADTLDTTHSDAASTAKTKKRNKSVSFMLEDHEEVVIKKTKSEDTLKVGKSERKTKIKDRKKHVKKSKSDLPGKENKGASVNIDNMDVESPNVMSQKILKKVHLSKQTLIEPALDTTATPAAETATQEKKKKFKKAKKHKPTPDAAELEKNNNDVTAEAKNKKHKNKKHHLKHSVETEGEPAMKNRKDDKADIAEDLESLSIGDNTHTLTNLLDEMTVVDKDKQKKLKHKRKKTKKPKATASNPEPGDSEKNEEEKEKIKWKRRKWNRDKKGDISDDIVSTSVIVENLPLSIMLNYKKLLTDHFVKYGLIRKIGIAELYPTEESKPVFTTTINFYSDGAAEMALELNNSQLEGSRIRVKRPLPPTRTTLVVRSYAELSEQALSSAFLAAGKIRSIRQLVKGKKAMATAFVEFDGPESVDRAIKMAANAQIGGKKMHAAKFELRTKKSKVKKPKGDGDSAAEADSEDSND